MVPLKRNGTRENHKSCFQAWRTALISFGFERERCPIAGPFSIRTCRRLNHVYGFNQPHPARLQAKAHTPVTVRASRHLLRWVQTVHGHDERARERTVPIRQTNRKILPKTAVSL